MTIEELRQAREQLGMTQSKMAACLRTGLRQYQKWEGGEAKIRPNVALSVELLLAISGTETGKRFGV